MKDNLPVKFWTCMNHGTPMHFCMPRSMYRAQFRFLPFQTMENAFQYLLCDGCNHIQIVRSMDAIPQIWDTSTEDRFVHVEKIFEIDMQCAGEFCQSPVRVFAPTTRYMTEESLRALSKNWILDDSLLCPSGNSIAMPLTIIQIRQRA